MSRSIIQTALSNKSLHLELEYQPSRPQEGGDDIAAPMTETGIVLRNVDPRAWDDFVSFLRVI